ILLRTLATTRLWFLRGRQLACCTWLLSWDTSTAEATTKRALDGHLALTTGLRLRSGRSRTLSTGLRVCDIPASGWLASRIEIAAEWALEVSRAVYLPAVIAVLAALGLDLDRMIQYYVQELPEYRLAKDALDKEGLVDLDLLVRRLADLAALKYHLGRTILYLVLDSRVPYPIVDLGGMARLLVGPAGMGSHPAAAPDLQETLLNLEETIQAMADEISISASGLLAEFEARRAKECHDRKPIGCVAIVYFLSLAPLGIAIGVKTLSEEQRKYMAG
ncbi:hypothetical protein DL95DRAFT_405736, partial [Leptodontidium sp. 2 PMI_412]